MQANMLSPHLRMQAQPAKSRSSLGCFACDYMDGVQL
jgi:hypothetical protein